MKQFLSLLLLCTSINFTFGQAPEKLSYQAIVRDASGNLLTNTNVGLQMSILQSTSTGPAVYVETFNVITNINGLLTTEIGTGTVVSGNFSSIDWGNGPYFIQNEIDPTGGVNYTISGSSECTLCITRQNS